MFKVSNFTSVWYNMTWSMYNVDKVSLEEIEQIWQNNTHF